jgi:hypothetical protein
MFPEIQQQVVQTRAKEAIIWSLQLIDLLPTISTFPAVAPMGLRAAVFLSPDQTGKAKNLMVLHG